jgi:hypothetical protein
MGVAAAIAFDFDRSQSASGTADEIHLAAIKEFALTQGRHAIADQDRCRLSRRS